jgi:hypothetical protein
MSATWLSSSANLGKGEPASPLLAKALPLLQQRRSQVPHDRDIEVLGARAGQESRLTPRNFPLSIAALSARERKPAILPVAQPGPRGHLSKLDKLPVADVPGGGQAEVIANRR